MTILSPSLSRPRRTGAGGPTRGEEVEDGAVGVRVAVAADGAAGLCITSASLGWACARTALPDRGDLVAGRVDLLAELGLLAVDVHFAGRDQRLGRPA